MCVPHSLASATIQGRHLFKEILVRSSTGIAPFYTLALKPVSTFKEGVLPSHITFTESGFQNTLGDRVYTAALN